MLLSGVCMISFSTMAARTTRSLTSLPAIRKENVEFDSVVDAMSYAERADDVAYHLRLASVRLRKLSRAAMDEEPALSFGKASVVRDAPLLVAIGVFFTRRAREREGVSRSRLRA